MTDHYGAISSPPELEHGETEPDDWYARIDMEKRIDRGEVCPVCKQAIQPHRIVALGVSLFECPHCRANWIDCTEKAA